MKRCAVLLAALLSIATLAGCYRTELPLVTRDNAHPAAVLADGTYCEAVFRSGEGHVSPVLTDTCITLAWVPEARGWRTDTALGTDEHGVSVRMRKLGTGSDAVGLSSFFLVQAGPPPRQTTTGSTVIPMASAYLMGGLVREDMFVLIGTGATQTQSVARAQAQGIGLAASDDGFSVRSIAGLSGANMAGAWMAGELAREIHAAELPGTAFDPGTIRIFVPRAAAGITDGSPQLLARMRLMLDAVLFEAGVFNQALGLGLAPPRIALATLDTPAVPTPAAPLPSPSAPTASPRLQAMYDGLQYCKGMFQATQVHALLLQTTVSSGVSKAVSAGRHDLAEEWGRMRDAAAGMFDLLGGSLASIDVLLARFEAMGADRAQGEPAFGTGFTAAQLAPLPGENFNGREVIEALRDLDDALSRARDCAAGIEQG